MTEISRLPDPRARSGTPSPAVTDRDSLRSALERGDDVFVRQALNAFPPPSARAAWEMLDELLREPVAADETSVRLRYFAFPMIIVAGARSNLEVSGALPDVSKIVTLLEQKGALGPTRNFGLGNALCPVESLEKLSPSALWRSLRETSGHLLSEALEPGPLMVRPGREQVHLRFLVGAGVTPDSLPSLQESASNVGTWGMPVTHELAHQLAQPGLEILPLLRPPVSLTRAAYLGRRAQLEAALDIFLSNSLRRFRMSVGDPVAVLSSHHLPGGAGELRLSLSSPLDESMLEGFCWPLHPLDEVIDTENLLTGALTDYGVRDCRLIGQVMPDMMGNGMRFVTAGMAETAAALQ